MDKQSGDISSSGRKLNGNEWIENSVNYGKNQLRKASEIIDTGGCSKILHKCEYDKQDFDLYIYCPKVAPGERILNTMGDGIGEREHNENEPSAWVQNFHPTVKPIALLTRILKLFKTPNPQLVIDPFAGSGTTAFACNKLKMDYILIEKDKEYFELAKTRINENTRQQELF